MRLSGLLGLLVFALALVSLPSPAGAKVIPPSAPTEPFEFWLDDSLPPEERWSELVDSVIETYGWDDTYGRVLDFIENMIPHGKAMLDAVDGVLINMGHTFLDSEIFREILGVYSAASEHNSRATLGRFVLLNMFYDVTAGCTSFVASSTASTYCHKSGSPCASEDDRVPVHGRNLDFPIPGLANMTSIIHLVSKGEVVARTVGYTGYVGVLTGYRPGGWSVSVNQRNKHVWTDEDWVFVKNIIAFLQGAEALGTVLRRALVTVPTYQEAIAVLSNATLSAPTYLTVGGVRGTEGAVITRDRKGVDTSHGIEEGVWEIPRFPLDHPEGVFYRAETNDDHWNPALDRRREAVNKNLLVLGANATDVASVMRVLKKAPTYNAWTTFASVMSPAFDILKVEVNPVSPTEGANMEALGELFWRGVHEPEKVLKSIRGY